MNATTKTHRARHGFTLIEVLTVIVIIGILAGVALPVIFGALAKAKEGAVRTEIEGLSQALESYKLKYGDYPPDFSDWSLVERHYRRAFPSIAQTELDLLRRLTDIDNTNDTDFSVAIDPEHNPVRLDRAEALVWALGGFSQNPELPFTGSGGPFSLVSSAGMTVVYQINTGRAGSLFDFDPTLLSYYGTGTGAQQVDPATGIGVANRYLSTDEREPDTGIVDDLFLTYKSGLEGGPYVYFDSRTYDLLHPMLGMNGYSDPAGPAGPTGGVRPMLSDRPVLRPAAAGNYMTIPEAANAWEFLKPDTFQIISGGLDGTFGNLVNDPASSLVPPEPIYFQYPTGQAITAAVNVANNPAALVRNDVSKYQESLVTGTVENPIADNMANFSTKSFDDDLP